MCLCVRDHIVKVCDFGVSQSTVGNLGAVENEDELVRLQGQTIEVTASLNMVSYNLDHRYILDAVPPVHVVSNHVDTDKLTTANGRTFISSSTSLSSQSR